MNPQQKIDLASEAQKAAPPIAVSVVTTLGGVSLQDWVYIATIGYIVLQAGWLVWRWWRAAHTKGWKPGGE